MEYVVEEENMDRIRMELDRMGIPFHDMGDICILQDKDGIVVARVQGDARSCVLKCFQNGAHRREISNYRVLQSLNIPTIAVVAETDSALLLEDLDDSPVYRLGTASDLADPVVARRLAGWYRQLHQRGYSYVARHGSGMYDEADFFTQEHIAEVKEKTGTQADAVWKLLGEHFDAIHEMLGRTRRTLTYNDFYYTNLAIARDRSAALMFDYNLLGKGYAYSDVRNVLSSLAPQSRDAFLAAYGAVDPLEMAVDDVVSPVVTLCMACRRTQFPDWAADLVDEICTTLACKIQRLMAWCPGRIV